MRVFSVPADFKTETVDAYQELNHKYSDAVVGETYGCISLGTHYSSGRNARSIPGVDPKGLESYINYCRERGIDFNYTFNASCLGNSEFTHEGLAKLTRQLSTLWSIGVRHLTISLPQMMTIVKESGFDFTVKVSTICQINSAYKAIYYKNLGIDRIVIDEDITRDFRRIRQVVEAFGEGVEMIVNSACDHNCPYKMFHYNHESHYSFGEQDIRFFFTVGCKGQKTSDWKHILKLNWTRPEDQHFYEEVGIKRFKLQGRQAVAFGDPVRTVEAYMSRSFDGNLFDLLELFDQRRAGDTFLPVMDNRSLDGFLDPFVADPNHCTGDCASCGYCEAFAERCMDRAQAEEMVERVQADVIEEAPFDSYRKRSLAKRLAERLARKAVATMGKMP
jgi:collagenase-like PrtC family protease